MRGLEREDSGVLLLSPPSMFAWPRAFQNSNMDKQEKCYKNVSKSLCVHRPAHLLFCSLTLRVRHVGCTVELQRALTSGLHLDGLRGLPGVELGHQRFHSRGMSSENHQHHTCDFCQENLLCQQRHHRNPDMDKCGE